MHFYKKVDFWSTSWSKSTIIFSHPLNPNVHGISILDFPCDSIIDLLHEQEISLLHQSWFWSCLETCLETMFNCQANPAFHTFPTKQHTFQIHSSYKNQPIIIEQALNQIVNSPWTHTWQTCTIQHCINMLAFPNSPGAYNISDMHAGMEPEILCSRGNILIYEFVA